MPNKKEIVYNTRLSTLRHSEIGFWLVLFALLILFLMRSPVILSKSWSNTGMLLLSWEYTTEVNNSNQRKDLAEQFLQRSVHLLPHDPSSRRNLGFMLLAQNKESDAMLLWNDIDGMAAELSQWGKKAQKEGDHIEAINWYQRSLYLDPSSRDNWVHLGIACELGGHWSDAASAYYRAIELPTMTTDLTGTGSLHYRLGRILQWHLPSSSATEIKRLYQIALQLGLDEISEEADIYANLAFLGWWRRPKSEPDSYIADFIKAIHLNPDHFGAHLYLGRAYFLDFNNIEKGKEHIEVAIALRPEVGRGYLYLGDIYLAEGKRSSARIQFEQALNKDPNLTEAQERLQAMSTE